jgi:7-keto-8-aminopelargonate synthetase-like enzyme
VDGRRVVIFSSNDYLGLSAHPKVVAATAKALRAYGTGTGGAPGTTGTTVIHEKLRAAISRFKRRDNAILFPSGYQANQAIHQSLDSEKTVFLVDRRHHPSALDGIRLSRKSQVIKFDHSNLDELEKALIENRGNTCIVSLPSVFTVDGDIAPLDKLHSLKKSKKFLLLLDEAHATGCLGRTGRGIEEHFNLKGIADFIMGTFSKAIGSQGGFLTFDYSVEKYLTFPFRTFEYSTSLSTASAAAALASIELIEKDRSLLDALGAAKTGIIDECRKSGIEIIAGDSMVMLIPCLDTEKLQAALFEDGFLTIPVQAQLSGQARQCLRITPMALHTSADIKRFVRALEKRRNLIL